MDRKSLLPNRSYLPTKAFLLEGLLQVMTLKPLQRSNDVYGTSSPKY